MRKIIIWFLLSIIALASCSQSPAVVPTMAIITPTIKALTPTITPTIKPSATALPAASAAPSATAEPFVMSSKTSPNGEFTAYSYFHYGTEQQTIEIKNKEGKLIWQIPYQGELPHSDPRTTISIHRWANDSSQLYFCYSWSPDGGDIFIRYSCSRLQTIDIKTGEIRTVVPDGYTSFRISNNGSEIAYLQCTDESCTIHIQNLSTGSEKTTSAIDDPKDYVAIGSISWSPNDNGLVFHTQDKDYIMLQTIYLDVSKMKLRLIKKYPVPYSRNEWAAFDGWVDDNTLIFVESENAVIQVVYLNIRSNESIVIGTPTPSN
ncbi:MAG: hypothetical protein ABI904_17865 [Chloroflexota bacterium]